jgi:hypothetical protein
MLTETKNFTAPPVAQSDAGDFALKDFKNVSNDVFRQKYKEAVKEPMSDADFLAQAKKNGLAENDLADVDLQKLYDKGIDSGLMSKDGSNFLRLILTESLKQMQLLGLCRMQTTQPRKGKLMQRSKKTVLCKQI